MKVQRIIKRLELNEPFSSMQHKTVTRKSYTSRMEVYYDPLWTFSMAEKTLGKKIESIYDTLIWRWFMVVKWNNNKFKYLINPFKSPFYTTLFALKKVNT